MSQLSDFQAKVNTRIQDDAGKLTSPEKDSFIAEAVSRYGRHCPLRKVADIAGNGGYDYPPPTGWVRDFSRILEVEYPTGSRPAEILTPKDWEVYEDPAGQKLRLLSATPNVGETIRMTFTLPHTVDAVSSTVPSFDEDAVCELAAALCCEALANHYAQTADATINADVVNYRTKSQEYASRAKRLMKLYFDHLGIDENSPTPASGATANWDTDYSWGADRLGHPRRLR